MAKVEQKHLEGLTFKTSELREVDDGNGGVKKQWYPVVRPLTVADIISQRDDGGSFHIVAGDGRKYDVPKKPARDDGSGKDEG